MPKYYIRSGKFSKIVDSPDPKQALVKAFSTLDDNPVDLSIVTMISEHGFDSEADEDMFYDTYAILEQVDQIGNYKSKEWFT